ncbi:Kinesin-like protein KIN-14E [Vitis vinifera]|uniref:Kinesin-like protein KIN-14E n=1 Tax=Vitis vinifera TaxID=29760 RepID=A0A438H357_VITVI|nr:Kinesin-like protein KIN-14E [Vitis vinifera]
MTIDMPPVMAQTVRTSRSSFSSSNGNETPLHNSATISNGDGYDSDGSNFAPLTPGALSAAIPAELAGAIPLIDRFQVGKDNFYAYERIELVGKLYKQTLKRPELRDELFAQISKQTRNNPDRQLLIRAWELMYLCASSMPPSKDIGGYLSEYVHNVAHGMNVDSEVQVLALYTLNALKRSIKAGPRHTIPGREEIEALLTGKKLTTIVFFLDETFEEIAYDMATTVADAVEVLKSFIFYIDLCTCVDI